MLASTVLKKCSRFVMKPATARSSQIIRNFTPSFSVSSADDLPYHIVVGMPALSPTMETGVLSEWFVEEGSEFSAGQSLAKIETDKASIDFEAQDDGFIAKILIPGGSGDDIECGVPIMVTVEEADDVAAFANFVAEAPPVAAAEPVAEPEPVVAATPAPPPTPVVAVAAAVPIPVEVSPPAMEVMAEIVAPVLSIGWGEFAKINSPILKTLSRQQNDYIEKYGTTGQVPL